MDTSEEMAAPVGTDDSGQKRASSKPSSRTSSKSRSRSPSSRPSSKPSSKPSSRPSSKPSSRPSSRASTKSRSPSPSSRPSSRASNKSKSGGSKPDQADTSVDKKAPCEKESEKSPSDKQLLKKHGLKRFIKVDCGERLTIPEKCKRSSGRIDLRRLKDAQPALFKNAGSSKSSEHERKKSSDQPSKSTSSKPTSNGGHESKSKKREDNAKEKKLFGSSSDSDDSDLERMKKKVVKPSLFKPDNKSTDLTVKSKVEQPSLFKPDKKSTDPTAKPKTEQLSLFKPDSKSTDLTVKPKTEEPAVKPDLKPDKTDTKKHITESSTKKPEDTKKDVKVKSEKKEAPSGFFPPKPFSIVVEKITKSQIEKWEEDCSSAPPAPIPKIKNRPMKPAESKSPTPAPRRRFSSSSSSSSSRRSRSRKRSSSGSSRSSSRGARPAKKKLPPARKRFSSSSSSSSRSRSPPPAPKRPPVIKKPSQPPKKPEFTRPKAKAIRSDSSSDSGSSRGRRKARSDSDSDDSPKRSKEPPKKLVKNPMMFINPFAKQEDPEEAAKAAAVKAALMEKIANIAAADTPDKKEDKKDPFKIPKRRDTTEEKKGEEKDQKHKDREAEKKREQKKEQKPESKPKGVLFDAAYLLRSSSRLRPFMNLLKIECGEGTLSFLRRKVTMSEFEAHVNRAMKNLESESPRPTKHLGNYSQKRPHGEEAQKYKLKHLTINLSDLKTSDQKNIQLLKDATPKWETYRKSYCRRRRHTLQDGIKEIKRKVEGDRERERDHREKDRHSERPPIPKIPKKPIDPRFERTSELSQSKAPLKTNSYNMGWKAATGNKGPKRFENFQEQKRWEEEQATSFDIRRLMGPLSKKNKEKKADEDDEDMPACQSFGTQAKQIQAPKEPRVNKFANTAAINNDAPMPMIVKLEPGQPDLYMHHSGESFTLPMPGMYPRDTPTDLEVPGGPWSRGPFSAGRDNEMFQGSEQRYRGSSPSRALPSGPGPRSSRFDQPPPGFGQPPPGFGQPPPGFGQPPPGIGQPPPNPSPAVFANPYADNSEDERSATTGGGPSISHDDSGPIIVPTYNTSSNFDDIAAGDDDDIGDDNIAGSSIAAESPAMDSAHSSASTPAPTGDTIGDTMTAPGGEASNKRPHDSQGQDDGNYAAKRMRPIDTTASFLLPPPTPRYDDVPPPTPRI